MEENLFLIANFWDSHELAGFWGTETASLGLIELSFMRIFYHMLKTLTIKCKNEKMEPMAKKIILCLLFFGLSPLVLFFSVYFFNFPNQINQEKVLGESISLSSVSRASFYTPLPSDTGGIAYTLKSENSLPVVIEKYLRRYKSPLLPYANLIFETSVKFNVDPKLIVAIAQQESNLGKITPPDCFNAWGWGIHAKGTKCYGSWEEAIKSVIAGISENYCDKGYCDDPCVMMKKYTPQSNGSWCFGVNQFLTEMELGEF